MTTEIDDSELLRRYAATRDETAFGELVRRHVNLVYACAVRRVGGDAHLAKDVTQQVFCDLARQAGALAERAVLSGWLYTSTRFAAAKVVRGERRRRAREEIAFTMKANDDDDTAAVEWERLRPVLDDTIDELGEQDREAVVLRYFEGRSFAEIGARLRLTENAARMRVERALEKLQARLTRRGIGSTAAALGLALAGQAATVAPAGLAGAVTAGALAGGATAGGAGVFTTFMSMTKLQLGLAGTLAVAGVTGMVMQAQTTAALRGEVAALRGENAAGKIAALEAENLRLARQAVEVEQLRSGDGGLAKLAADVEQARVTARHHETTRRTQRQLVEEKVAIQDLVLEKLDRLPKPKLQERPLYPLALRNAGVSGEATVDFTVNAKGEVENAEVVGASHPEFGTAALRAVSTWSFAAGKKGGGDVATQMRVPVVFEYGEHATGTMVESARPKADGSRVVLQNFVVRTK
ncbi:MAG: TonB family protein [Verrucomicrobiota bacterium]